MDKFVTLFIFLVAISVGLVFNGIFVMAGLWVINGIWGVDLGDKFWYIFWGLVLVQWLIRGLFSIGGER